LSGILKIPNILNQSQNKRTMTEEYRNGRDKKHERQITSTITAKICVAPLETKKISNI
jgi:hypothetical protein